MKIGVLTYYGDLNCGTNLQAYATLQAIRNVFSNDTVEVIPLHGFNPPDVKPYFSQCTAASLIRDIKRIYRYKQFVRESLEIKKDNVIKNVAGALDFIKKRNYDRIYVGADTLLELDRIPNGYDGLSVYWLSPEINSKFYLMSASAKNVTFDSLSDRQKDLMKACVNYYSGICVRDKTTYNLISHFIEESRIKLIPDPTFTLDIDYKYAEAYLKRKHLNLSNVICLHTLRDDDWAAEYASQMKAKGYRVASLRPARWADLVLNDMSPLEQLGIYRYFRCFITHRFHDAVFCMKNLCPVLLYPVSAAHVDSNGDSKYSTLLEHFDLRELCLIPDRKKIVPEKLADQTIRVIDEFSSYTEKIIEVREEIKMQYMEALKETK